MPAQRQHLAVLYGKFVFAETPAKELVYHFKGLCVAHDSGLGVCAYKLIYVCGVIRLHMVYYQVIRLPAPEDVFQVCKPFLSKIGAYRVHHGDLFVNYHIGVVCHALRHDILPLKQVYIMIVYADITDIVCHIHALFSFRPYFYLILP